MIPWSTAISKMADEISWEFPAIWETRNPTSHGCILTGTDQRSTCPSTKWNWPQHAISWAKFDSYLCRHMTSLGHSELLSGGETSRKFLKRHLDRTSKCVPRADLLRDQTSDMIDWLLKATILFPKSHIDTLSFSIKFGLNLVKYCHLLFVY